jgi:hypothetical protein
MGTKHTLRAAVLAALALPLAAQAEKVTVEELLKRLEEQDRKIQVLEQKLESQAPVEAEAAAAEEQKQQILVLERKLELQDEAAAAAKASAPGREASASAPRTASTRSASAAPCTSTAGICRTTTMA